MDCPLLHITLIAAIGLIVWRLLVAITGRTSQDHHKNQTIEFVHLVGALPGVVVQHGLTAGICLGPLCIADAGVGL